MPDRPPIRAIDGGIALDVVVVPRASRDALAGLRDGRLVVRVTAPPVDQAANTALVGYLARRLRVARRDIRVATGAAGRRKTIEVRGVDVSSARSALLEPVP